MTYEDVVTDKIVSFDWAAHGLPPVTPDVARKLAQHIRKAFV